MRSFPAAIAALALSFSSLTPTTAAPTLPFITAKSEGQTTVRSVRPIEVLGQEGKKVGVISAAVCCEVDGKMSAYVIMLGVYPEDERRYIALSPDKFAKVLGRPFRMRIEFAQDVLEAAPNFEFKKVKK